MVADHGHVGACVAVSCGRQETRRLGAFVDYVERLGQHVLKQAPASLGDLAAQDWSHAGGSVAQAQQTCAEELHEVVRVAQIARFENREGWVWGYAHPSGSCGVLLSVTTGSSRELTGRVALQVAGLLLRDPVGDCGVGEGGALVELFDPLDLAARHWDGANERTVQDVLEQRLGAGTRIDRYACFRPGG